ncbi:hypothetical protein [Methylobacterium sp. WL6]|uniref:hypothetical protein n=1 Tax=Methylobacterium sp. WL6 TaxID=2603901 RepID=UPI0011C917FD|nr:hypothetical protein [Methylobacterium sp. WL6]TXN72402.1 hypothetical protein FV230_05085 [Methylobacterium sp. WL6]
MADQALGNPKTSTMAWSNAGFAVECTLKAAIMRAQGLNSWPSRAARSDLYTHDLAALAAVLGMVVAPTDTVAPSWAVVLKWRREHMYSPPMTRVVAQSLREAAFSATDGVAPWICAKYRIP